MADTNTLSTLVKLEQISLLKTYIDDNDSSKLTEAKNYVDTEIGKVSSEASTLEGRVDTLEGQATTLISSDTGKSVRTIANEELAAQLIPEGAKEALDTLQEIAAWIQSHPDDASAMNAAIDALESLVGKIPEGATATTVVAYITEVVNAAVDTINADVAKKADKAAGAVNGNFAGLDANGNLTDSGKKAADFESAGAVKALADGAVKTNTDAIAALNDPTTGAVASAKTYADGLNTAMDTRVQAVEAFKDSIAVADDQAILDILYPSTEDETA